MDAWQAILLALGGNAALLFALAWLARSFGSQLLAKDIEKFKSSLAAASTEATERLKHELQLVAHEHQVRFSKLHERRAEVIASLYALLVEAQWAGQSFVAVFEYAGEPPKEQKYATAMNKFAEFFRAFDKSRIYLPELVCTQLDEFLREMRNRVIRFGVYVQVDGHAPEHVAKEKYEVWTSSSEYFENQLPAARKALEAELRGMLSGVTNDVT
jgi:hypothetical protein